MISRPVPFDIPYSILLDSSGNGSFTYNFANDYWYAATVSGENSGGTPVWNIRRNNVILQPAVGTQVAMSAGVMSPGTALVITVSGGIPGSNVSGLIYGAKSSDPSELTVPVALPSSPGVIQVPQRFQLKVKASDPSFIYTVPYDGLVHTFVFTLPPGSLSARWYFNQPQGTPPASWTQLHISGNNTNPPWGTYTAGFDGEGGLATETVDEDANFRLWPGDTQLIITAQFAANGTNAAPFRFMLEASLSQEIVRAALTGDGPSASSNIGIFADGAITTSIITNQAPNLSPNLPPIGVSVALAGGATTTLLAASGSKHPYIFSCALAYDGALPGNGAAELQDDLGNPLHYFEGTVQAPPPLLASGADVGAGRAIQLHNGFVAGITMRGSLVVSQA